ncbi:MAG: transglutaminase family protein [Methylocystis sp.]|nr:transglutaminase family protein [Methylocystis sp.]
MRIRIQHQTTYRYEQPARRVIQKLRLTPRSCDNQTIEDWRIDIDQDCRLHVNEDAFGNIVHTFSAEGPIDSVTAFVEGEVETSDLSGVIQGVSERLPPELYLRATPLTAPSPAINAFAKEITARQTQTLACLHELLASTYAIMTFDTDATHVATTAADAFETKCGVCQDFAHLFIACARSLSIPARYVSGYFLRSDGKDDQPASHAWAEAFVEDLGWVGFDPAHGLSPDDAYVRVAVALDYLGAAPIRGARAGGGGETLDVSVRVGAAQAQAQ